MGIADQLGNLADGARGAGDTELAGELEGLAAQAADVERRLGEEARQVAALQDALRIAHEIMPPDSREVLARRCPQWRELLRHIAEVVASVSGPCDRPRTGSSADPR